MSIGARSISWKGENLKERKGWICHIVNQGSKNFIEL